MVWRRTPDQKVAGSTPGRGAIKSTRSTQPSIPPGYVNRVPACMAGVRRGTFTCVGWQVTLCDPIWQVTFRSSEVGFPPGRAISPFTFYLYRTGQNSVKVGGLGCPQGASGNVTSTYIKRLPRGYEAEVFTGRMPYPSPNQHHQSTAL